MRPLFRLGLLSLLTLALAACASGSTPAPAASTAPASASTSASPVAGGSGTGGNAVTIQNFAFGPASLDVAVGTTVTWTNKDSATHTVTANDASFDGQVPSGQTFSQTVAKA